MKRWALSISLMVFSLSALTRAFSGDAPLKTVNIAVPAVSLLQAPLFVAIDAGAFKRYGMDVRYIVTGARAIQALVGGSVQFAQGVSSRTVPAAVLAGADTVLIANFSDKLLFTMHSAPEIQTLQDLKSKVVEGAKILTRDEEFALRVLSKHTRIADREILNQSYGYLKPYFLKVPYPSQRSIKDTLDVLAKDIPKAKDADPREFVDNSIVKEIESSGYLETVYGK